MARSSKRCERGDKRNSRRNDSRDDRLSSKFSHEKRHDIQVRPVTENQKLYVDSLRNSVLTIVTGPPGCCKSIHAAGVACQDLTKGKVDKIIITRSATSTSRGIGFVPGTSDEKCMHWYVSMLSYMKDFLGEGVLNNHLRRENIVLAPMETMMGRSFNKSWIIVEEAQLMTMSELITITTRIGKDSKMTLNGDYKQNMKMPDFKHYVEAVERHSIQDVSIVRMCEDDIVRSKLVKDLSIVYNKENLW